MDIRQEDFQKMKRQIAAVRQEREKHFPYAPELERTAVHYALQDFLESALCYEIGVSLGLEEGQLARWFREVFAEQLHEQNRTIYDHRCKECGHALYGPDLTD